MDDDTVIRVYNPSDENGIVELLQMSFPFWKKIKSPLNYWRWKYLENPKAPIIFIAETDGKIVGVDHFTRLKAKIGESTQEIYYGDDAATHPDYRGRGIYNKINRLLEEERKRNEIKIAFSFTTSQTVVNRGLEKGRLPFPHQLINMLNVNDIDLYLKTSKVKNLTLYSLGFKILKTGNTIVNQFKEKQRNTNFEIIQVSKFKENMWEFWKTIEQEYSLIFERSNEYLNWRYSDPTADEIKIREAVIKDEVIGYVVTELRNYADNIQKGYILDLLALPERLDAAGSLLENALSYFNSLGINGVEYQVIRGHPYQSLASKYNLVDTSLISKRYFSWQYKGAEKEYETIKAAPSNKIHFTLSDYL